MGNDGGSIPTRRELVKEAARQPTTTELKATLSESLSHAWTHDPLSHTPLALPIVSDSHGRLYNKDSIIEFLLPSSSSSLSSAVSSDEQSAESKRREEKERILGGAVRSLRDVVEVRFEVEKAASNGQAEIWKCPITAAVLGPGSKAVYLVPCGHAFSGAAIKEVAKGFSAAVVVGNNGVKREKGGNNNKCLVCETEYADNDVVSILPTRSEEVARLVLRAKTLREKGLTHSLKKDKMSGGGGGNKKRKIKAVDDTPAPTPANGTEEEEVPVLVDASKNGKSNTAKTDIARVTTTTTTAADNIRNSSTASLTARVMAEQDKTKKRRLENENLKTLFSNRDQGKPHGRSSDFMTRGFDIPAGAKR